MNLFPRIAIMLIFVVFGCDDRPAADPEHLTSTVQSNGKLTETFVKNQYLQIRLPDHWSETQNSDPAQFTFVSNANNSHITVSYELINVSSDDLKEVIEKYVEFRMKGEAEAAFPRRLKLRNIEFKDNENDSHQVIYAVSDETSTFHYSFFGVVLQNKIVSLFCESIDSTPEQNHEAFEEALTGLKY